MNCKNILMHKKIDIIVLLFFCRLWCKRLFVPSFSSSFWLHQQCLFLFIVCLLLLLLLLLLRLNGPCLDFSTKCLSPPFSSFSRTSLEMKMPTGKMAFYFSLSLSLLLLVLLTFPLHKGTSWGTFWHPTLLWKAPPPLLLSQPILKSVSQAHTH